MYKTDSTEKRVRIGHMWTQILSPKYWKYAQLWCAAETVTWFSELTAFILGETSNRYYPAEYLTEMSIQADAFKHLNLYCARHINILLL